MIGLIGLILLIFGLLNYNVVISQDSMGTQLLFSNQQSPDQRVLIELFFNDTTELVKITYSGPSKVWYGIGFNATQMSYTYAIIIDGYNGTVSERQLGLNSPGQVLQSTTTIISNTVNNNIRTVKLKRNMTIDKNVANSNDYYTFQALKVQNFSIIYAYGNTPQIAYHQNRSYDTFFMAPPAYFVEYFE